MALPAQGQPPTQTRPGQADVVKPTWSQRARPYLILTPAFLLTAGILIPFVYAIYLSLTNFSFRFPDYAFVGLENYREMFTSAQFWHSVSVTLQYALWSTGVAMLLGLGVAMLLNNESRYAKILRVLLIFPLMIAPVVATLIWQLMTNPSVGVLAPLMNAVGLGGFRWAAASSSAMFTVVMIDVWVYTPFVMVLALAGLKSLPKAPYEAAQLDGGSAWFTFRTLTLPMITPHLLIALIFRLMVSLQEFSIIFAATKGGPGDTLLSLSLNAYNTGFLYNNLGQSIPLMMVLWVIVFAASWVLVRVWGAAQRRAAGL